MRIIPFLLVAVICPSALAQSNLGELLDRGAVRLGKEALTQELLASSWIIAPSPGEITYRADGTYSGYEKVYNGGRGIFGTWEIDTEGKLCFLFAAHTQTPSTPQCTYWYKLEDRYFASRAKFDRSAPIFARVPKKP